MNYKSELSSSKFKVWTLLTLSPYDFAISTSGRWGHLSWKIDGDELGQGPLWLKDDDHDDWWFIQGHYAFGQTNLWFITVSDLLRVITKYSELSRNCVYKDERATCIEWNPIQFQQIGLKPSYDYESAMTSLSRLKLVKTPFMTIENETLWEKTKLHLESYQQPPLHYSRKVCLTLIICILYDFPPVQPNFNQNLNMTFFVSHKTVFLYINDDSRSEI